MKARGKREAQRNPSPLVTRNDLKRALKVRNIKVNYSALSELHRHSRLYQGRRASRCSALAPGFHISRLRRWRLPLAFIFRAFGAGISDFLCKALQRFSPSKEASL